MNLPILIFALLTILALALLWRAARRTRQRLTWEQLVSELQPLDLGAFRNLLDPEDARFLREQLPAGHLRRFERQRRRAAVAYARTLAHNAGVLTQLGDLATQSADGETVRAGSALRDTALMARMFALKLRWQLVFGAVRMPAEMGRLAAAYDEAVHGLHEMQREPGLLRA